MRARTRDLGIEVWQGGVWSHQSTTKLYSSQEISLLLTSSQPDGACDDQEHLGTNIYGLRNGNIGSY